MKFAQAYSPEKFLSFSYQDQLKALDKLILALESVLGNTLEQTKLIGHLLELGSLLDKPMPQKLSIFLSELKTELSPHQLLGMLYVYHNAALRKDSQLTIRKGDGSLKSDPDLRAKAAQISLICDNLRSVFNVGSLFRSAECLGLGELILCGISPTPQHANMAKTAMGTETLLPWRYFPTTEEALAACRTEGKCIYALETAHAAKSVFNSKFSLPLALVIGNESLGIESRILQMCDETIILPQLGWKNSLNVGVATAAALYQIIFGDIKNG